jgi:nucleoside-diphosphate-sugar epimerase
VQKLACESYLKVFWNVYGLETVGLRYFNVFGPRQDPKSQYAAVIPNFVTAALQGRPATIYGDGEQSRDFCFIDNVVEANVLACTAKEAPGEILNIACGEATSLLQVIDIVGSVIGTRIPPKHDPPRQGDIKHSLADIGKARRILGYDGRVRFREGIEKTIAWYRAQRA